MRRDADDRPHRPRRSRLPGDAPPIADGAVVVDARGHGRSTSGAAADVLPRGTRARRVDARARRRASGARERAHARRALGDARQGARRSRLRRRGSIALIAHAAARCAPDEDAEAIDAGDRRARRGGDRRGGRGDEHARGGRGRSRAAASAAASSTRSSGMDRATVFARSKACAPSSTSASPSWPPRDLAYAPAPHTLYTTPRGCGARAPRAARAARRAHEPPSRGACRRASRGRARRRSGAGVARARARSRRPSGRSGRSSTTPSDVGALVARRRCSCTSPTRAPTSSRGRRERARRSCSARGRTCYIEVKLPPLLAVREAGIEAALGTDSLASNASLDVARRGEGARRSFPGVPAWELVKMATWNGARALGRDDSGASRKGARPGILAVEGDVVRRSDAALPARQPPLAAAQSRVPRSSRFEQETSS